MIAHGVMSHWNTTKMFRIDAGVVARRDTYRTQQMKLLSLDVDGVLNDQDFCRGLTTKLDLQPGVILTARHISDVTDQFNPACVAELARIVRETGCKIVISSAWRKTGIKVGSPFMNALVKTKANRDDIQLIRRAIVGKTPNLEPFGKEREDEIRAWLEEHPDVEEWVAVDDMPLNLDGHSVRTSDEVGGLTREKADEVIRKLNG